MKIASPNEPVTTLKAWELYLESLVRHKNRIAALAFVQQREGQKQVGDAPTKVLTQAPEQNLPAIQPSQGQKEQLVSLTPKLGNPYFQEKYLGQWKESLNSCFSYDGKILEGKHRVISCGSHSQVY